MSAINIPSLMVRHLIQLHPATIVLVSVFFFPFVTSKMIQSIKIRQSRSHPLGFISQLITGRRRASAVRSQLAPYFPAGAASVACSGELAQAPPILRLPSPTFPRLSVRKVSDGVSISLHHIWSQLFMLAPCQRPRSCPL